MNYIFHITLISFLLLGCHNSSNTDKALNNKTESNNTIDEAKPKPKVHDLYNQVYYHDEFETTDFLIKNTIKDLRYVQNVWYDTLFLSFNDGEIVTDFIRLDSNRILVETEKDKTGFLYIYNLNGEQLNKQELDLVHNFYYSNYTFHKHKVYFTSWARNHKDKYWILSPDSLKIKELPNPDDYLHLFKAKNYDIYNKYTSPDGSITIEIDYNEMFLIDNSSGSKELLINIHSDSFWADWCFDNVYWHDNSKKFYFDNSGEIACIWEVDLERKTIDKIVPEHFAELPMYMDSAVYYLDRGGIRRTHFVEYGKSRKIRYSENFDTIKKIELEEEQFHVSTVKNYPDSLLLPHTMNATLAVNSDGGNYKIKFLYALNDTLYLLTSGMTLSHTQYKCDKPMPYYSNGFIEFKCDWTDGRTYGDKFKVEEYKLTYYKSYYTINEDISTP